jgi:hypothetical protein
MASANSKPVEPPTGSSLPGRPSQARLADRLGDEGLNLKAYNPASRRGHLKEDDADVGIGLFHVHAMG